MFKFEYSVLELISTGLLAHKTSFAPDRFRGSASFKFEDEELYLKKELKTKKDICDKKENKRTKDITEDKKIHRLNKSFVKRKLFAFFNLYKTRKFCKFWTVTFPAGTQDDICYKLFNLWLTRCRQNLGLKDYLWVAERQKNETIHFHMCINMFMPIRAANEYMKISINNCIKSGEIERENKEFINYNGVNVSKNIKSNTTISKYMVKYMSKNETTAYRLLSYCSKSISALFTSQIITEEQLAVYEQRGAIKAQPTIFYTNEFIDFYLFKFSKEKEEFTELFALNESIYKSFYN